MAYRTVRHRRAPAGLGVAQIKFTEWTSDNAKSFDCVVLFANLDQGDLEAGMAF